MHIPAHRGGGETVLGRERHPHTREGAPIYILHGGFYKPQKSSRSQTVLKKAVTLKDVNYKAGFVLALNLC